MFQTETFSLIDASFYDDGVTDPKTVTWILLRLSPSISSSGTLLSMSSGQTWGYYYPIAYNNRYTLPFCVEVDIVAFEDSPRLRWAVDNTTVAVGNITSTGHYKYIITATDCTLSINGGTPSHLTGLENASKNNGVEPFFELDSDTDKVTYKNFVIYPI